MALWKWLILLAPIPLMAAVALPFVTLDAAVTNDENPGGPTYDLPCSTGWEMLIWGIDSYDGNGHGPSAGGEWFVDPGFEAGCAANRNLLIGGAAGLASIGSGLVAAGVVLRRRAKDETA